VERFGLIVKFAQRTKPHNPKNLIPSQTDKHSGNTLKI